MAGKKKRRKKKSNKTLKVFGITLLLTILAGCSLMFGAHAVSRMDGQTAAVAAKGLLRKMIVRENEEKETTWREESGMAQEDGDICDGELRQGTDGAYEPDKAQNASGAEAQPPLNTQEDTAEASGQEAPENGAEMTDTDEIRQLYASGDFAAGDKIYAKETADPEEVSLVFAGDILFDDNYAVMVRMKQRGGSIESSISADMLQIMREADIFMVNNEFPYSNRGEPTPDKQFTFRGRPEYASYLLDMGADIVSLANNHASDYGTISLTDTIDVLNSIGMPFVGAGRNLEEAAKTAYFVANGMKIAILSATQIERMENPATKGATESSPGVFRCLNIDRLLQEIREAKQISDFVIVYIHWGTESTDQIDWAQREQAPKIAEAGADLIIGDHPHVLQPIGYCGNVPVIYSLGNYLFNSRDQDTCLVRAVLDGNGLKSLQFIPGRQQDCSVTMHYGAEKERVLTYMRSISPGVSIDADGFISKQ